MHVQRGFSLVELMVTLFVAAILLTMAVPSFQVMVEDNSLTSQINLFIGALSGARSEAVKRGQRVGLCKSANGSTCVTTGGYEQGWIVFVDNDNDGVRDTAPTNEELLRVNGALRQGLTLRGASNFANGMSFVPSGGANNASRFVLCKDNQVQKSRALLISLVGQIRLAADNNGDGVPQGENGNNITCPI
jgi:type IV fimbrial biogenesis protein FimT